MQKHGLKQVKGFHAGTSIGSFSEKLGQSGIQARSQNLIRLSLDDQLKVIAEQRYDATQVMSKPLKDCIYCQAD